MYPTLYHTFKGFVKGLSSFHVNPVDVRKVINMDYRKDYFVLMILNTNIVWKLNIMIQEVN